MIHDECAALDSPIRRKFAADKFQPVFTEQCSGLKQRHGPLAIGPATVTPSADTESGLLRVFLHFVGEEDEGLKRHEAPRQKHHETSSHKAHDHDP